MKNLKRKIGASSLYKKYTKWIFGMRGNYFYARSYHLVYRLRVMMGIITGKDDLRRIYNIIEWRLKTSLLKKSPYNKRKVNFTFLPTISVVSAVYNKQREIKYFIEALQRQSYKGKFEVIFADDCSSDNTAGIIQQYASKDSRFKYFKTDTNAGQCGARNLGVKNAIGDILIIMDSDHIINADFLKEHAERHLNCVETDVVIGPYNIETGDVLPEKMLSFYVKNPQKVLLDMQLQEPSNVNSFVNCITRNFSIKRRFLNTLNNQPLFDENFSYTAKPDSGFGWEDVEMGFRLYQKGVRIEFEPKAFSIHISHPSTIPDNLKPLGSVKNFRKLLEKHPDFALVAKKWTYETFIKISEWLDRCGYRGNEDKQQVESILADALARRD